MFSTVTQTAQKFTTEAGPRQTKNAIKALDSILFRGRNHIEITGTVGGEEHRAELWIMTNSTPCDDALRRYTAIGEQYDWTITAKNHKAIIAEAETARDSIDLPEVDNRKTVAEVATALEASEQWEAKKKIERDAHAEAVAIHVERLRATYPNAIGLDSGKSNHARAAANMKRELSVAFPGVAFSVKSDSYSLGNSVGATWADGPTCEEVDPILRKYRYGTFDAMTDYADTDDSPFCEAVGIVLGTSKHVNSQRDISDGRRAELLPLLAELLGLETINAGQLLDDGTADTLSDVAYRVLRLNSLPIGASIVGIKATTRRTSHGSPVPYDLIFETIEPEASSEPASDCAYTIVKSYHEKRQHDFWIAAPVKRLDRQTYLAELGRAETFGGWKSRKWGKSPSGYGFKTAEAAAAFTGNIGTDGAPQTSTAPKGHASDSLAERFETMAEALTDKIESARAPLSQNWTPKRGRQHASKVAEGNRLERTQRALTALAGLHRSGNVPALLAGFRTKTAIYDALGVRFKHGASCYDLIETSEYHSDSAEAVKLQSLIAEAPEVEQERQRARELQSKIDEHRRGKHPGFFPTPRALAERMVSAADIEPGDRILEPSAGIGDLADVIAENAPDNSKLFCVEQVFSFAKICKMKGHHTERADFLEFANDATDLTNGNFEQWQRVIMNPPFEHGADVKHVLAAWQLLKPGGRLVSLLAANALHRSNKYSEELYSIVKTYGIEQSIIDGAFNGPDAFKKTGVSVLLLVLGKPAIEDEPEAIASEQPAQTIESLKAWAQSLLDESEIAGHLETGDCIEFLKAFVK